MTSILHALAPLRGGFLDEASMHAAVASLLDAAGITYTREVRFSRRDRIDFVADGVGIECKISGGALEVARQLYRYADHLNDLVLVTTKARAPEAGPLRNSRGEVCRLEVITLCNRWMT